ncbi:reverse transcriptase domain-containing protein [Tanacetum coccineum]
MAHMAQMLQAPIEGYEDAIVVPPINANNFKLKQPLINLVQSNKFTDGEARDWLDKEPPRSILTWDDLVSKFINQFFPPSKTTYLRNKITNFFQEPNETFNEAWEHFKGLLRQCPHHGFLELHQLDTFYNSLNSNDQDDLDSAAGGNFLDKMPQEGLAIIESKSKVCYSRSRANDSRVSTDATLSNSSPSNNSFDMQQIATSLEDKLTIKMNQMMNDMKALVVTTPATVKAVEEVCVTCGSNHNFNHCPLTRGGNNFPVFHDNNQQFQQTTAVEPELNSETSTEKVQNPNLENVTHVPSPGEEEDSIFMEIPKLKAKKTINVEIQDLNSPNPNSNQSRLPYPERMKVRGHDKPSAQYSRFLKMFKQLRLEIGLKDALVEMPKFNKWLSSLLRNKEKLEEIAIMTVNAECSAIIMNRVPEKLEDPGKFLIPCALQELDRTNALADSGASINLLPHSIYKKLGLEALTPTRMTLELANRSISHPMGIAEDVVVRVDGFTFLADFVVVNFEPNPRVPIIIGRPFLQIAKALIDLYEEKLTLRVGKDELVYYANKSEKNKDKNCVHAISIIDFSKDDPFSGSTTNTIPPSSSPVKTSDNLEKFADELTPLNSLPPGNDDSTLKKDFQVYSNPLFEFDDNFKSSNVNPLFEENAKDVEIKSSSPVTLTSPEESELEAYLEKDSIPPGIDLTLPPNLDILSSNPTSPTLTGEKVCSWKTLMFLSLVRFVWKMLTRIAIRKKIIYILETYLHKKPKPLSQEVEEIKENEEEVSSDVPIDTNVMPIRITFDNPIDFNDHFSKPKDLKKDLTISFDSTTTSILLPPVLDSDSPFTAELSASVTLNSLRNEDKVFKLVFKEPSFLLPPPEPPDECLKNVVLNFYQSKQTIPLHVEDINTFASVIWTFLPYFIYIEESPLIFSFRSENFIFDPGIVTFHNPVAVSMEVSHSKILPTNFLKTLVSGVVSRSTRASHPLYGYIKNHKKTVKIEQARTRESEEYKKKPKNQSRSQKSQASFDYLSRSLRELAHSDPIPPGVVDTTQEPEEEIRLAENLSYDNSSPRLPEEHNSEIADTIIESLSPPPIPVEDSDSLMEEIDLFLASDDSMPPGIEIDDYDSAWDIRFLEELLSSDFPPLPENESFSLDHFDDPSLPRPPPEPPDVEICFNFEPNAGIVTKKVVGDISEHDVLMPYLLPTQPTLCPRCFKPFAPPFSSENEDKVFKPGIFSSPFSSHLGPKTLLIFLNSR